MIRTLLAALLLCAAPIASAASGAGASILLQSFAQVAAQAGERARMPGDPLAAHAPVPRLPGEPLRPVALTAGYELPQGPDRDGLKKDTYYFLFSQFFVIGVLYVMPEDMSGWSEEQKEEYDFSKWRDNVSEIVWDKDRWWLNYVLHPYWGGAYFVRARERGYDEDAAFWYSMLLSTFYEYGVEALFERPSVQDMILTPGLGFFVGKYMMSLREGIRAGVRAGQPLTTGDRVVLFVTDPLGAVNKGFDRIFGIEGDYHFSPFMVVPPPALQTALHENGHGDQAPPARGGRSAELVPGFQFEMHW